MYILDAHSDVTPALIDNCVNISNNNYVKRALLDINMSDTAYPVLISPDAGSNKKCNKLFSSLNMFDSIVKCDKVRDMKTGNEDLTLKDQCTWEESTTGSLKPIFLNGLFLQEISLTEIRETILQQL